MAALVEVAAAAAAVVVSEDPQMQKNIQNHYLFLVFRMPSEAWNFGGLSFGRPPDPCASLSGPFRPHME